MFLAVATLKLSGGHTGSGKLTEEIVLLGLVGRTLKAAEEYPTGV